MFETFLDEMFRSGEVVVGAEPLAAAAGPDEDGAAALLAGEYERARRECPGTAPAFAPAAARAGAVLIYNGCVCLVNRALEEAEVATALSMPEALPADAAAAFSLDLAFSRLPDLLRMAEGAAPGDPLVVRLRELAGRYPLSSVGTGAPALPDGEAVLLGHPALRRLYADRVIERRDAARLDNPGVLAAVQEALGAFTELWPEVARRAAANEAESDDA